MTLSHQARWGKLPRAKREVAVLIRVDNMDALSTEGQLAIRMPLDEIGPETLAEFAQSALEALPNPLHDDSEWSSY